MEKNFERELEKIKLIERELNERLLALEAEKGNIEHQLHFRSVEFGQLQAKTMVYIYRNFFFNSISYFFTSFLSFVNRGAKS
jgi:hypothetical protein